jgi:uncharacterized protein YbjQ (UPF0145 family)
MSQPQNYIPQAASERIARLSQSVNQGSFTSDLSVDEFFLLHEIGFDPLGYVMGTSIYHVGIQIARWGASQELNVLTSAMYNARELAMARMRTEAASLGADGIVGVNLRINQYAWGQDVLEFIAEGTAVKCRDNPGSLRVADGGPFTSDLSGQGFFNLIHMGHVPVALVLGSCVYHVAHQSAMQAFKQSLSNQEIMQFTEAVYTARELAMQRMQFEADRYGAHGVVGVRVIVQNHVWGAHATEFLAIGTAVKDIQAPPPDTRVQFTLPLTSGAIGGISSVAYL